MTGIVILPAGRDDAFRDYQQFVRDGHPIDDIEHYLDEEDLELFQTTSDADRVHVWGTSVDGTWQNVERNDIATLTLPSISGRSTLITAAGTMRVPGSI